MTGKDGGGRMAAHGRGNARTSAGPAELSGPARRVTIFIGESDRYHHRPLYAEIVHRAHQAGMAGASVFRGIEGFGASSLIHTTRLLSLSQDLPLAIIVIDVAEKAAAFLAQVDELVTDGLVVVEDVIVHRYVTGGEPAGTADQDAGDPAGRRPDDGPGDGTPSGSGGT